MAANSEMNWNFVFSFWCTNWTKIGSWHAPEDRFRSIILIRCSAYDTFTICIDESATMLLRANAR